MKPLFRLIISAGFALPVSAAVTAADLAVACEVTAADDDRKPQGDKEPECE